MKSAEFLNNLMKYNENTHFKNIILKRMETIIYLSFHYFIFFDYFSLVFFDYCIKMEENLKERISSIEKSQLINKKNDLVLDNELNEINKKQCIFLKYFFFIFK